MYIFYTYVLFIGAAIFALLYRCFSKFQSKLIIGLSLFVALALSVLMYVFLGDIKADRESALLKTDASAMMNYKVTLLEQELQKNPDDNFVIMELIDTYIAQKNADRANFYFGILQNKSSDMIVLKYMLFRYASVLNISDGQKINADIEKLLSDILLQNPKDADALLVKALILYNQNQYTDALETLQNIDLNDVSEDQKQHIFSIKENISAILEQ